MRVHVRREGGFLTIELLVAIVIIVIALLALMAAYDQAFFSINSAAKNTSAGLLAENELELYRSLPYSSIGLDPTTLTSVKGTDATYSSDEAALPSSDSTGDVTISGCGSSPQCSPVQTLTGSDHQRYKLETFIRSLVNVTNADGSTWNEKVVTVVVRDLSESGSPKVLTVQSAYDHGPAS